MTTVTKRTRPMSEMLEWLESNSPFNVRGVGLAPYVRVEDFVDDDVYVLRAELPGIDPESDVEVTVEHDVLTIAGERREQVQEKNHSEFHYGSFRRSVSLPTGVRPDAVTASYRDGVLEVRVPLTGEAPPSHRVPIQRGR